MYLACKANMLTIGLGMYFQSRFSIGFDLRYCPNQSIDDIYAIKVKYVDRSYTNLAQELGSQLIWNSEHARDSASETRSYSPVEITESTPDQHQISASN